MNRVDKARRRQSDALATSAQAVAWHEAFAARNAELVVSGNEASIELHGAVSIPTARGVTRRAHDPEAVGAKV